MRKMQHADFVGDGFSSYLGDVRHLTWKNPHQFKLYGYGVCKGKPTPKIAENKVQYLKFLVSVGGVYLVAKMVVSAHAVSWDTSPYIVGDLKGPTYRDWY